MFRHFFDKKSQTNPKLQTYELTIPRTRAKLWRRFALSRQNKKLFSLNLKKIVLNAHPVSKKERLFLFNRNFLPHILIRSLLTFTKIYLSKRKVKKILRYNQVLAPRNLIFLDSIRGRNELWKHRLSKPLLGESWLAFRFPRYLLRTNETEELFKYVDDNFEPITKSLRRLSRWSRFASFTDYLRTSVPFLREIFLVQRYYGHFYFKFHPLLNREVFLKSSETKSIHNLVLKFNKHRFFISLLDWHNRRNYISLYTGALFKYLEGKKKSSKKALTTKLLLMRFLRKLLILSNIKDLNVIIKGVPLFVARLFNGLNRPLAHIITDPISKQTIDETGEEFNTFRYHALTFLKLKPFGYQKPPKKGRIKRKIKRKIIRSARVIDEM